MQQAMSANAYIYSAIGQAGNDLSLLLGGTETTQHFYSQRKSLQPLGKRNQMLLSEYGGRDQNGHLPIIHNRLEGSAQCYLGFAIADISADKPVRGLSRLHILLDRHDGLNLVRRFRVGE